MSGYDVVFILDPLSAIDPLADSSYVMITEALRRGHRVHYAMLEDLYLEGAQAWAHLRKIAKASDDPQAPLVDASPAKAAKLADFDVILMRKDPPVDDSYITATWCLDLVREQCLVLNDPRGLRTLNEKLAILPFEKLSPPTRVLRKSSDLRRCLDDFGGRMIVKPILGFGGREILRADASDPNLSTILEVATRDESRWTVAQAFIESASEGDKRILLVDGEAIGAVLRVPAAGELRNNFHAGGSPAPTELDERDLAICAEVGPFLRAHGQFFAGIDVIGGYLTEINVTSPTGMQEINRLRGLTGDATMQALFWSAIEKKLS